MRVPEPVIDRREAGPSQMVATPVKKKKRRKRTSSGHETAIWDGFVKAPTHLETTIQESLLYPFWGARGSFCWHFFRRSCGWSR